jgi:iron complex outermembrane recepter protein
LLKTKEPATTAWPQVVSAVCVFALLAILAPPSFSALPQQKATDLTDRSLEDLMNVEVTSVSKKPETLSRTASAVFVITQEDISRSGATTISDLLRMVPGVDVAQINANAWAVSVRGFNGRFSNELLVLLDGRSVYTSSFGGVFWDVLDLPLDDIDRIEVIRGPGGSAWGANAVNGVINIITKKTSATRGGLVVAGGGNVQQGFGTLQYGGKAGSSTDYRVYAKYFNTASFSGPDGQNGGDGWHALRGGFRTDSALTPRDTLTFQGDLYTSREGTPAILLPSITSPAVVPAEFLVNLTGGFLQGDWDHSFSPESNSTLQISYDRYQRNDVLHDGRGTLDLTFQHHYGGWSRQNIVWGLEYRRVSSDAAGGLTVSFVPAKLTTQLFGAFVQDEITLVQDRLFLTVGARLEHSYYTGVNVLPSARVAWTPNDRQTVWAAVSEAVRSPSQLDTSFRANLGSFSEPDGTLVLVSLIGNPHFEDEGLIAYEWGYRTTIRDRLSIDLAAYHNNYDNQQTIEPAPPFFESAPVPPHLVLPVTYQNLMRGETTGVEIAANWEVTDRWTLSPGYAFEHIQMHLAPTSQDTSSVGGAEGSSPMNSAQLRSHFVVGRGLTWDVSAYFVDRLKDPSVPSYTRVDTQLAWQFRERASLSIVGQNLLQDHHEEFVDATGSALTTEIKRSAYAKFTWQF